LGVLKIRPDPMRDGERKAFEVWQKDGIRKGKSFVHKITKGKEDCQGKKKKELQRELSLSKTIIPKKKLHCSFSGGSKQTLGCTKKAGEKRSSGTQGRTEGFCCEVFE